MNQSLHSSNQSDVPFYMTTDNVIVDTLDYYGLSAKVLSPLINKASEVKASLADEMLAAINA